MADECVVCGEAEEGKPLYKKLGSGEFNVEVITALKALQMLSIPEAAKNSSYICWDCDELVVEQYDSFLREQQAAAVVKKQTKKQQPSKKKKKKPSPSKLKLKISKDTKRDSNWGISKPQSQKPSTKKSSSVTNSGTTSVSTTLSKTKRLEQQRAANAYHSSHCLMCDNNFETERRIYQRFSLKNRINDEMDIAHVMEVLGLARHIAPELKARRFVCNPCFFIIRRNYKDKLQKETSEDAKPVPTPTSLGSQKAIHRATTEEHAAEIAKLLPPGLAECYKIVTENAVNTRHEPVQTSEKTIANENNCDTAEEVEEEDEEEEEEEEEEEGGLQVSQDEYGNYFIDIPDKGDTPENTVLTEQEETPSVSHTARRKKNVLLPRRMHKHLSLSPQATSEKHTDSSMEDDDEGKEEKEHKKTSSSSLTNAQESRNGRKCNICGITITGKHPGWWHTLTSPVEGFESINVTTALKLLETCLSSINPNVQEDPSVCLPCYTKVSSGIKSQVVQRIARHKNMDASEVNLSRVKIRMLPKEVTEPAEVPALQKSVTEIPESSEMSELSERSTERCAASEESGEGEKENMDIEKCGHKRKLNEGNVLPDKKRKLYKSGAKMTDMSVLDSSEAKTSQDYSSSSVISPGDGKRSPFKRDRSGRFLKKGYRNNFNVTEEPHQAMNVFTDNEEDKSPVLQASPERMDKTNVESKETAPLVVLKDLKFVLPQEAFSGKTVSSHKIESIMEPSKLLSLSCHSELGTTSSPLQLVFSALSTYHPKLGITREAPPAATTSEQTAQVNGCCVVCGVKYLVPLSCWHSVEEDIRPPTLLVPVRWVCISLAIPLPEVSMEDARHARVCKTCFEELGDQFEVFVKRKVGESCGLEAESVDLSEYLFTFNTETMNLEADPKQQSYIHEFEDVGQLLQRIQVLMEQFSLDEVVSKDKRQPVLEQHFCVWLLLVLNELRMQVGAAIGDLAAWLLTLMPVDMYKSGVRPCANNLATFLLNTTRCSKALTEDVLQGPIPAWVFVSGDTSQAGQTGLVQDDKNQDEDLCWEDFLQHVNLDALVGGKATPVSAVHFTQGLVYAVWRTSLLLGEGKNQVIDWLRQLSPFPLSREQLENLVTMIGQLHNHLEDHPQDIHELKCAIIPQLNEHRSSQSPSNSMKLVHTSTPSVPLYKSCVSEEETNSIVTNRSRRDKSTVHVNKNPESNQDKSNAQSGRKTPTKKSRKESPTSSHKATKRRRSHSSERLAKIPKRNRNIKATVNSSSQATPLVANSQHSAQPSDDHLDDSNTTPAIPESIQDASVAHKPVDGGAICEPDSSVLPHTGSTLLSEQHDVTTPTTSTVQSKDTIVTSGSSNGSPTNIQPGTDTIAKNTVPITESANLSEPPEQTKTTTKAVENTLTNSEPDEEIASITATSEQTPLTVEFDRTSPVSGSSEQITDGSDEETLLSSDTSEQTTDESNEGTLHITETSGKTTATDESDEEALPVNGATEDTVAMTGTSEQVAASTGSGAVESAEPDLKISPISKTSEEITTTTKSDGEIAIFKSSLEDTVATTSAAFEENTVTTKSAEDTIIKTSEKNASFMEPTKETVAINESADKSPVVTGTSEQTALTRGILANGMTSVTLEKTSVSSAIPEKATPTHGTSEERSKASETLEKTAMSSGTSENTALTSCITEKAAVASESLKKIVVKTSEETVLKESSEENTTTEESLEDTHTNPTDLTTEISASLSPVNETGASNDTSEKTTASPEHFEERETTHGNGLETILAKKTVVNAQSTEEIRDTMTTPEHPQGTLSSVGLYQDTKAASQEDTTLTIQETSVVRESSMQQEVTYDDSEKIATTLHSNETTTTNVTVSTGDGNISTTTADSHTTDDGVNTVITTSQHTPLLSSTLITPDTTDVLNTTQTTSVPLEAVTTKDTISDGVKAEISKKQVIECDNSLSKTLGPFKIQVSSSNKTCSDNTSQLSLLSNETSGQTLVHGTKVILKKTNEYNKNITNLQQSALRKSQETQIELEQKNEHHNVEHNGSTRTCSGMSETPRKVQVVIVPKKEGNTSQQVEDHIDHCKEKDNVQILHKYMMDSPQEKNVVVVPSKNSKDTAMVPNLEKVSEEIPVVVSSSKPPLHRSERVCIKVSKNESIVGSKKDVRLYQKERLIIGKEDNNISHGSSVNLGKQEDREGNNNTEIPSSLAKASSQNAVRLVSVGHNGDKPKHTSSNSENYQLEDTNTCTVQKMNEVVLKHKHLSVEKIHKVPSTSAKKVKASSAENHCDKGNNAEEMPNNSRGEKKTTHKKYHKPLTPRVDKDEEKKYYEKTPSKSLLLEENKQSKKGKFSSPASIPEICVSKIPAGVTPGKQVEPCRTPKGKKQKLTFEELMNYDAGGLGHS